MPKTDICRVAAGPRASMTGHPIGSGEPAGMRPVCAECGALRVARPSFVHDVIATIPEKVSAALAMIPTLTPREFATLELLGYGYDNRSISRVLRISERTAKRHVSAILSKLTLESRLQAGLVALIVSSYLPSDTSRPEGPIDIPFNDR